MYRNIFSPLGSMLVVLGLSISAEPAHGQTISFNHQFTTPEIDRATVVAADASGIRWQRWPEMRNRGSKT